MEDELKLVKAASIVNAASNLYPSMQDVDKAIEVAKQIVEKAYATIV